MQMPEMGGIEATQAIRQLPARQWTPIVAMTANVQETDIEKCLAAGMDDHLAKPLTLENLGTKLTRWITHYTTAAQRPEPVPRAWVADGSGTGAAPVDAEKLGKLREQLGSAFAQAIRPFLEDMPVYLEQMEQAIAGSDADALGRAAHSIKGAAGNLGCEVLAGLAREIEESAIAAQVSAAAAMVAQARAEYALVQQALLGELKAEPNLPADDASKGALVLVVDDDRSTRATLRFALQRNGFSVEEAVDGVRALALLDRIVPDVILMDVTMPNCDGVEACRQVKSTGTDTKVVMLTMHADQDVLTNAIRAGAIGYLTKDCSTREIAEAVRMAAEGDTVLSPQLARSMLEEVRRIDQPRTPEDDRVVTKREEEVLQLIADGCSTPEVAANLYISQKTVKNHLASIYQKLDARDRTQAVLQAVRMGIVSLD